MNDKGYGMYTAAGITRSLSPVAYVLVEQIR